MSYKNLQAAKNRKCDEFYTQLEDIERELKEYRAFFINCDDAEHSNFLKSLKAASTVQAATSAVLKVSNCSSKLTL